MICGLTTTGMVRLADGHMLCRRLKVGAVSVARWQARLQDITEKIDGVRAMLTVALGIGYADGCRRHRYFFLFILKKS